MLDLDVARIFMILMLERRRNDVSVLVDSVLVRFYGHLFLLALLIDVLGCADLGECVQ